MYLRLEETKAHSGYTLAKGFFAGEEHQGQVGGGSSGEFELLKTQRF